MDADAKVALVRSLWQAVSRGDLDTLAAHLDPDAHWRAVEDGPWNCESRTQILDFLRRPEASGRSGALESAEEVAGRVVVGVRPAPHAEPDQWPLEDGIRSLVVTLAGDRIVELKGCATRAIALAYASRAGATFPSA